MLIFAILYANISYRRGIHNISLKAGQYKVYCYGGEGGRSFKKGELESFGGKGAYVSGTMTITGTGTTLYAYVGGYGSSNPSGHGEGGFNGGGRAGNEIILGDDGSGGGGGATDIRLQKGNLSTRVMVAAGGSGAAYECDGAPGGTLKGRKAIKKNDFGESDDVTQLKGRFDGIGGNGTDSTNIPGSGGGGGWRGGISTTYAIWASSSYKAVAHSGSSYISGFPGCVENPQLKFKNGKMEAGVNEGDGKIIVETIFQCSSNCQSCSSETKCTKCFDKYNLYNNGKECRKNCPNQYIALKGKCEKCTSHCATCKNSQSNCLTCLPGYNFHNNKCLEECPTGHTAINGICQKCSSPCSECSDSVTSCTSCETGYLYENKCSESCQDGFVGLNGKCEKCTSNCATCEDSQSKCLTCDENYHLYNSKCIETCPPGTTSVDHKCESCSTKNCEICENSIEICTKCIEGFDLENGECSSSCPSGQTMIDSECKDCNQSCIECSVSVDNCLSCKSGLLYEGKCYENCPKGSIQLNDKCETCSPNCESCQGSTTTCVTCKNGSYLLNGECVTKCPPNYYINNKKCEKCDPSCSECSNSGECDSCSNGYYLQGKQCIKECKPGYFGTNRKCEQCTGLCIECSTSSTTCTKCDGSHYLYDDKCIEGCPPGTTSIQNKCEPCSDNCATCENTTSTCTSCSDDMNLFNNECRSSCSNGYTSINGKCEKCTSPCIECASSQTMCTACPNNNYLYEYKCYTSCPPGTLLIGNECVKCDTSCKECSNSIEQCVVCSDDFYRLGDRCYSECSSASDFEEGIYYGNNDETKSCEKCIENGCIDCTADYKNCSACDSSHIVDKGECYPPDYVLLIESNCSEVERCSYSVEKMKSVHVVVLVSNFTNKDQKLPGGGFYIINCAVSCHETLFINCSSNDGGGAIYVKNFKELSNDIDFGHLTFFQCKAIYGGAVYIYSSYELNNVTLIGCKFYSNKLKQDNSNTKKGKLNGGCAFFLTSKNADIKNCTFENNKGKGGALKIYNIFDENNGKIIQNVEGSSESEGLISISNCQIKISQKETNAIFIEGKKMSFIDINECKFKGKLGNGVKYIGGKTLPKNIDKIQVTNCQFEYKEKSAMKIEIQREDDNN